MTFSQLLPYKTREHQRPQKAATETVAISHTTDMIRTAGALGALHNNNQTLQQHAISSLAVPRIPLRLAGRVGIHFAISLGMVAGRTEEQFDAFDDPENGLFPDADVAVLAVRKQLSLTQPEGTLNPVLHQKLAERFSDAEIPELGLVGVILAGVAKFMLAYDLVEKEDTCPFLSAR